ncbi:MAG: pyridine nucleotide-disulfide oxidoreductase [Desulfobulbaceae bacterium S3730MH12]|nr:MAG: pyridine nucleotide-disulfide oxidoreductase [Desulfobulbaceae bacterium S3730MH12]
MTRKILVVGGVAGGASAAARLRRLSEDDQIIMFEKGVHVSFSNCCLPYHLSGAIPDAEDLVLLHPENFASQYNIDARVNHEVVSINRKANELTVRDLTKNELYTESYDKLILSPGARPIVPPIPGMDKVNIFTIRNVIDIDKLNQSVKSCKTAQISVIGGGFIGVEIAENLKEAGYKVTLIEAMDQIMRPFDFDMVQILHKELYDNGIDLILSDQVSSFEKDMTVLQSGRKIESQIVVLAIGVTPETQLAKEAGLDIGKTGAMKVDQNYRTNDQDIYAIGDVIEVYGCLFNDYFKLPLAGPAQKQARHAADHMHGLMVDNRGFIGSSVIKVFNKYAASTGLSEGFIKATGMKIDYQVVKVIPRDIVGIMPGSTMVHFKLIYEKPTGKILGAQAIGNGNIDKRIDIIATIIKFSGTIHDLKDLELCYAPPFGTAKDVVNFAGYVATNLMKNTYRQVHDYQIRDLVADGACIIDIREKDQFEKGHLKAAVNIPFSQVRDRISEFPTDKPIFIYCRTGQDSYNVVLTLQYLGFEDVHNVCGGFMGISYYEYFTDKTTERESILTGYNFE